MFTLTLSVSSALGIRKVKIPSVSFADTAELSTLCGNQMVREKDDERVKARSVESCVAFSFV